MPDDFHCGDVLMDSQDGSRSYTCSIHTLAYCCKDSYRLSDAGRCLFIFGAQKLVPEQVI
jgi:hypothetical protein